MVGEILKDPQIPGFKFVGANATLGAVVSDALVLVYFLATFLAFFFLIWGAFQYMVSQGDKDKLAHARSRMIYAIVGLLIILAAFMASQYLAEILNLKGKTPIL